MKLSLALKNLNFLTCKLHPYEISWKSQGMLNLLRSGVFTGNKDFCCRQGGMNWHNYLVDFSCLSIKKCLVPHCLELDLNDQTTSASSDNGFKFKKINEN